ncbi:MAG TPA: A/G-specific adenine glycosylase [Candidatus Limnocylindria bacterium]|nr:A/G-specific adenine glycosylase [Candidatus Limnocylindria bacterium]
MSRTEAAAVRAGIAAWYAIEHREFPWRGQTDPYAILVSEVMLQQTQAGRVAERFPTFMQRFPSAAALAAAPSAAVLAAWSGLGYNRRALALRRTAAAVAADGWPRDVEGLQRLPGIGPYTARALASLAFGVPVGVVDTNVRRWLLRRFGGPDAPRRLQELADALAAPGRGDEIPAWTHATMEFGARICTQRAPRCDACPVAAGCPSRGIASPIPVPRQARFAGSDRQARGAILRRLAAAPDHAIAAEGLDAAIVDGLAGEGLLHRSGGRLRLGGRLQSGHEPEGEPR